MRPASIAILSSLVAAAVLVSACKDEQPPPNTPPPYAGQPGQPGYPPPGQPGYPPPGQPGYPPPGQPPPGQPGYPPAQPAGPTLAVPGPQAIACSNDSACMSHKCNVQYGKCAFPCETDFDCVNGLGCMKGGPLGAVCLPKMPGQ
ncbi:MAG: hypothetical protein IPF92_01455 [Myxococcales bacterium]|nr:hypothetical protein [Myxococcales bacterium]MBL0193799.1 hypothetical protein [Myxococcales bacterium]HQY63761.1 hypothetical protein [Polyangiaceae bacterium]